MSSGLFAYILVWVGRVRRCLGVVWDVTGKFGCESGWFGVVRVCNKRGRVGIGVVRSGSGWFGRV